MFSNLAQKALNCAEKGQSVKPTYRAIGSAISVFFHTLLIWCLLHQPAIPKKPSVVVTKVDDLPVMITPGPQGPPYPQNPEPLGKWKPKVLVIPELPMPELPPLRTEEVYDGPVILEYGAYRGSKWRSPISDAVKEDGGCICLYKAAPKCYRPPSIEPDSSCTSRGLAEVDVTDMESDWYLQSLARAGISVREAIRDSEIYATMADRRAFGVEALRKLARQCNITSVKSYWLEMRQSEPFPYDLDPPCPDH